MFWSPFFFFFLPHFSHACAAGASHPRCWWMRNSRASSWKSTTEPRTRATPAWPTNRARPEEAKTTRKISQAQLSEKKTILLRQRRRNYAEFPAGNTPCASQSTFSRVTVVIHAADTRRLLTDCCFGARSPLIGCLSPICIYLLLLTEYFFCLNRRKSLYVFLLLPSGEKNQYSTDSSRF